METVHIACRERITVTVVIVNTVTADTLQPTIPPTTFSEAQAILGDSPIHRTTFLARPQYTFLVRQLQGSEARSNYGDTPSGVWKMSEQGKTPYKQPSSLPDPGGPELVPLSQLTLLFHSAVTLGVRGGQRLCIVSL